MRNALSLWGPLPLYKSRTQCEAMLDAQERYRYTPSPSGPLFREELSERDTSKFGILGCAVLLCRVGLAVVVVLRHAPPV